MEISLEGRYSKERDFHNKSFSEGTRGGADRFYEIINCSRAFYEGFLAANCLNKNVLEYGCGPGSYAFFLAQRGASVTGIDISDIAIDQAREDAKRKLLDKIDFRVMNAEALEFSDNCFDLICGTGILHHLDLDKALPELSRTLDEKGKAIFIEPLGHNPLINIYRKVTPKIRTEDEHPLLVKDFKHAERFFGKVETYFFHLHSLMAVPFRNFSGFTRLLNLFDAIDRSVFKYFPVIRKYAWMVVLILHQPLKM